MSRQVRCFLLGWFLRAIHLPGTRPQLLGILCHLCGTSAIHCPSGRGPSGGSLREQVDDVVVHIWLFRCHDILFLQGTTIFHSVPCCITFTFVNIVRQSYNAEAHIGVRFCLGVTDYVW